MRILIDITHPAHVHFFKNAIWEWQKRGHDILITARDKEIALRLLKAYGFGFTCLSTLGKGLSGLFKELIKRDYRLYKMARRFRPDVLIGIGGVFIAHVGKLVRKPSIVFYDTEFARLSNTITYPFATSLCTPACYVGDRGDKHIRYEGYHELAYLHPDRFAPDPVVLDDCGLRPEETFFIVRFVGWGASHDLGEKGFSITNKIRFAKELAKRGKILISSEAPLPDGLKKYKSNVPLEKIHHVMAFATLYIGESATMASESAVLGVPAIYISKTGRGYTDEQERKYGLVFNFTDAEQDKAFGKMLELLGTENLKQEWKIRRDRMLREKIDVTSWMVDFIENYPESVYRLQLQTQAGSF